MPGSLMGEGGEGGRQTSSPSTETHYGGGYRIWTPPIIIDQSRVDAGSGERECAVTSWGQIVGNAF